MIQAKTNPDSPTYGLQLGNQDAGCCVTETTECLYYMQFANTPASYTVITIGGVAVPFVHTFSTPETLAVAIGEALAEGGYVVHDGDIKAYYDPYSATANRLTVEIKSGVAVTNMISNLGTQAATARCTGQTMCEHRLSYTLSGAIELVIDNKALTLTTYATAALLRTAILAQITAQSLTDIATAKVKTSATAGEADVVIYAKSGVSVYHDGEFVAPVKCTLHYV